ncbi:hypothetical protein KUTeg_009958 [Tegillarca granosa]|uniref:Major facilitator superfamily (MFS) profile domain-containing protein n=1 Tax=Tegillarca granosa TaxID=220873 RepID=A0ABQ9FAD9_TEGGR|nr:hypothetical protein KUTeg_009958 [Tegillarca granosa]
MFNRFVKFTKGDKYEDLAGDNNIDMDITDPAMRQFAQMADNERDGGEVGQPTDLAVIGSGNSEAVEPQEVTDVSCNHWLDSLYKGFFYSLFLDSVTNMVVQVVVFAGMMFSSGFWGSVCDKYGRRTELILCSVFTCYFGILSAFSPNFIWILILRGCVGFGIGGAPQSVTLYAEFLPSASRATCVVLVEIFWALGACFEVLLALAVMPTLGWKWLLGFSALPLLIFSSCCFWLPESARYDITRGQVEKALATIERIAKENGKPMPLGRLVEPSVKVIVIYRLVSAFSYYGIVLMTTELFETSDGCHGSSMKVESSCFITCKGLTTSDYVDLTWTTFAEFPGLFVTVITIEKIGRKPVLTFFLFVARAFISGAFQAAYVYTPEVLLQASSYMAISTYGVVALIATVVIQAMKPLSAINSNLCINT